MRKLILLIALLAAVTAALALWLSPTAPTPMAQAPSPSSQGATAGSKPVGSSLPPEKPVVVAQPKEPAVWSALQTALAQGPAAARAVAAELRRRARTEPVVRDALGSALLDSATPAEVRIALAVVLGTIDEPVARAWLVRAAGMPGSAPEIEAWAVYALAAKRDWTTDDVFHGMDNPSVMETADGLQLCVSEPIDDPESRLLLCGLLFSATEGVVLDAAVFALGHSMGRDDARGAFERRLGEESDHGRVAQIGAALADWSIQAPANSCVERERIGRAIFGLAEVAENTPLRFALQPYAPLLVWPPGQGTRLLSLAQVGNDFDQRYWAIELLGRAPDQLDVDERAAAGPALAELAAHEPDDKLREKAVTALAGYGDAGPLLLRTLRADPTWHVRLAAVRSLERLPRIPPDVAAALEDAGARDPDERVRDAARELLRRPPR